SHHNSRDRQQLIAGAGVGLRLPQVRHINDGCQARDQAREDIDERQPALDRDAGVAGAFGREADGKERPANGSAMEQQPKTKGDDKKHGQLRGDAAQEIALAEEEKAFWEVRVVLYAASREAKGKPAEQRVRS